MGSVLLFTRPQAQGELAIAAQQLIEELGEEAGYRVGLVARSQRLDDAARTRLLGIADEIEAGRGSAGTLRTIPDPNDRIRCWPAGEIRTATYRDCAARQSAATAAASSQNHRSPAALLIFVRSYQGDHGVW